MALTLNRKIIKKLKLKDETDDGYIQSEMSERISMIWDITIDTWSFVKGQDAKQRLQRNVTTLIRKSN